MIKKHLLWKLVVALFVFNCGYVKAQEGGYLFAHMRHKDGDHDKEYGRMCYYISKDAKTWTKLNNNKQVEPEYRGHPDIIKGRDGRYYMIGVSETTKNPILWTSKDLVKWKQEKELSTESFTNINGYYTERVWFGAPKLYFDKDSDQYIITWHACKPGATGKEEWTTMRTLYILTKDFKSFTAPQRLFDFKTEADREMATIDVIIRKINGSYYAVIKDERWPEDGVPTGKTIRISKSKNLTGPYTEPSKSATTPNVFVEAPILMPKPNNDGWFIFAERYPYEYLCFEANSMDADKWEKTDISIPDARHGAIVRLSEKEYKKILSSFNK